MLSQELQAQLIDYTARTCEHRDFRSYIGLSGIGDCDRVNYDRYFNGVPASSDLRLTHAIAYDLEGLLIERLMMMGLYRQVPEISLFGGLVQGHVDGEVAGDLIEIKTVKSAEHFPIPPRLPNRVFYQVQAYLHYTGYQRAHVIYLARDAGQMRVIGLTKSPAIGQRIETKLARLVQAVQKQARPACVCGYCKE